MYRNFGVRTTLIASSVVVFSFFATLGDSTAAVYKQGTFSIKPIILAFSNSSFGFRKEDMRIEGGTPGAPFTFKPLGVPVAVDAYRNRPNIGFAHPRRNAIGYSFELGYSIFDNLELFVTPSISYEKGHDPHIHFDFQTFKFENRTNYGAMFGARKYFDIESEKWVPYVSLSIGFDRQEATKVIAFSNTGFSNEAELTEIGRFTVIDGTTYFLGELTLGVDYKINSNIMLTFMVGLNYKEKGSFGPSVDIGGSPQRFRDNHSEWAVPISAALKFAL